jgi:outer membrane protein
VENALSYDTALDITDDVIGALDKRSIDLSKPAEQGATPAGEPEEQPAPAVEKPAEQPAQPAEPAEPAQPAEPAKPAQ